MGDYMRRDMGGRPSSRANVQQLKLVSNNHMIQYYGESSLLKWCCSFKCVFLQLYASSGLEANVSVHVRQIGQSHPTGLTTSLLRLFEPRPPIDYKPPVEKRKLPPLSGQASSRLHFPANPLQPNGFSCSPMGFCGLGR